MSKSKSKPAIGRSGKSTATRVRNDETGSVAQMMALAYRNMARYFQKEMGLSPAEADAHARKSTREQVEWILNRPADQITWWDLASLAEIDDEQSGVVWEIIKTAARDELDSGHRSAKVMEFQGTPYKRAQYLAIRQSFIDEWQPKGGIELALIDVMSQSFQSYLNWMTIHTIHSEIEEERDRMQIEKSNKRKPRPERSLIHLEQSFQMMDRFNRIFLRSLRQLRDLRRYSSPMTIQNNGGQVNIAADGGQQLNLKDGSMPDRNR